MPLLLAIRMPGIEHHAGSDSDPGKRGDESDLQVGALGGQVPDDLRQPVQQSVRAGHEAEPAGTGDPQPAVPERRTYRGCARACEAFSREISSSIQRCSSPDSQDASRGRVRQEPQCCDRKQNRGRAFDQQHPAPAGPVDGVVRAHQPAGERASANRGNGNREHERRDGAGAIARRNPLRQVEHDARRETAFGDTEQQAQRVEGLRGVNEGKTGGRKPPDPGAGEHPAPHADPLQQPEARPLDEDVPHEEDADAEAVRLARSARVPHSSAAPRN